jgi:hypothetical protein
MVIGNAHGNVYVPGYPGPPIRGGYDSDPGPPSKNLPFPPRPRPEFHNRKPELR